VTGLLHDALVRRARDDADRVAIRAGDRAWTYAELDGLTDRLAGVLAGHGVGPGARAVLMSSNRVEFIATVLAVSKLGGATVLVSPAWKEAEVRHACALTAPVHAVADGAGVELLGAVVGSVTDLDAIGDPGAASARAARADDEAVLVFSSGTTGLPKAVRHTHTSLGHGTDHWVSALGLGPDDRFQIATPPSHILGLLNLLAALAAGATVRLHPRFDLDAVLVAIEADRLTLEMAVAPIALAMANHPDIERFDLSSLRYIMWGATPVSEQVAATVTARTGVGILPAYGASELPVLACNPVDRPGAWRLDSVGLPPAGVELRIVDPASGAVLPAGGVGEIQGRSPSAMAGYLPEDANADAFDGDWYRTGDIGWLDADGWVHITDRLKELIKVSGFQVAPAEIEAVLHGHPSVLDCAVFGVPDALAGEVPAAAVQLDPASPVPLAELQQLVADSLATYKAVRHIVAVDAVPRLPSGKVLRRHLRDEWVPVLAPDLA
jgi:long-chain acyl-CoA synthetase